MAEQETKTANLPEKRTDIGSTTKEEIRRLKPIIKVK
jgi:hypothetical protein